jgi:cytochrome P450
MARAIAAMLDRWQAGAARAEPLDVAWEMTQLTQRIIGEALFSIDLSDASATVAQAFSTVSQMYATYLFAPVMLLGLPTPRNRRFRAALQRLDVVVRSIIRTHRETASSDLLALLLAARDEETGQGMDDRLVRDEVLNLLLAGHETTANALAWTWYLLAQHPEVDRRLYAELDLVLGGRIPEVEDVARLDYTRMVFDEALRLYPPVYATNRNAVGDDNIGGYAIPAKSLVVLSPYMTHRHPDFWERPEVFDPERFTPERAAARPRYAYFPFLGGPRQCIGNQLALLEGHLVLATVAQRYRLSLVPGHTVEPRAQITLVPRYGLRMIVRPR